MKLEGTIKYNIYFTDTTSSFSSHVVHFINNRFILICGIQVKMLHLLLTIFTLFISTTSFVNADKPTHKELSKMRNAADTAFVSGNAKGVKKALKILNKVIKLEPDNHNNYYKRYRVNLRLKKQSRALEDLEAAVRVKPSFTSGWSQHAKLLLKMGKCIEAEQSVRQALGVKPDHKATLKLQQPISACATNLRAADQFEARRDYRGADGALSKALESANSSPTLFLRRARIRMQLKQYFEVLADSGKVLKMEKDNLEALSVRARAYYLLGDHEMALRHQREALKFDPGHKEIKAAYRNVRKIDKTYKRGEDYESQGRHSEAAVEYSTCATYDMEHHEFNKKAWTSACRVHGQLLKDPTAARAACQRALQIDGQYVDALVQIAKTYDYEENWEESVRAWNTAKESAGQGNGDVDDGLRKAQAALKQSKEKDYYKIIGVRRDATKRDIKKAYRRLALEWHPDKWAKATDEEKAKAEIKFHDIGEAAEVLGDEEKRGKFDRGEDVFPNQGGGGGGGGHHHFQQGGHTFHFRV